MRRRLQSLTSGVQTAIELYLAVWRGPYRWLAFVLLILLPVSLLLIVVQATPAVAPFVYTLF